MAKAFIPVPKSTLDTIRAEIEKVNGNGDYNWMIRDDNVIVLDGYDLKYDPTHCPEPVYTIGKNTMERVFKPNDLKNLHDLQAVLDAVEKALANPSHGWIVTNGDGTKYRTWKGGFSSWTKDHEDACRYARREDAEAVHAEDEDAWRIIEYIVPDGLTANSMEDAEVAHFDYVSRKDGVHFVALDTWERNNNATFLRLMLVDVSRDITPEVVAGWTDEQVKEADVWAWSTHMSAADHADIVVPKRPDFIALRPIGDYDKMNPITGDPI